MPLAAATLKPAPPPKLQNRAAAGWPPGVYVAGDDDLFRARVVVASELPRDRSTLLVRLMAAGPGLAQAIADLWTLPEDAPSVPWRRGSW